MRLLSASVRNYRVHRELHIDFDGARTLVGGPNESGKSTLVEAIHRALFLKATVTGEARKSMESNLCAGPPEVEVRFEADGAEYHLAKRFSGSSGTTRLVKVGADTWQGEQAESRLAALLGVPEAGGGRGILDRVSQQWSHLWVWQGSSGSDPCSHAASQQARLLQRLQDAGGAAAMLSELDARVAARFSEARSEVFTTSGAPRRGSELFEAQAQVDRAQSEQDAARDLVERLQRAVQTFEEAGSTIERTSADLQELAERIKHVREELARVDELRRVEESQSAESTAAEQSLASLLNAEESVAALRRSLSDLRESLRPKEEQQERLRVQLTAATQLAREAEQAHDQAGERTREVRLRRELAAACVERFERSSRCQELGDRLQYVQELQRGLDDIREQMAQLVPVDQDGLDSLQGVENSLGLARAALTAMAAEVEVLACDHPVQVGASYLSAGQRVMVTDATEFSIGDTVRIRINPGGGEALTAARERVRELQVELQDSLDRYGLESVAQASQTVARLVELRSEHDRAEGRLREWDASRLEQECRLAQEEWTAAEAEVLRRSGQMAGMAPPPTLTEARAWLESETESLRALESLETTRRLERDACRERLGDLQASNEALLATIGGQRQSLTGLEAQLALLLEQHGEDEARASSLAEARARSDQANAELKSTREALATLQPELLEADRQRLERAWDETSRQKQAAETERAVSQAALRSDGTSDPVADLARAEARLEAALEYFEAVSRKANAISLIDGLFQQEQRALADRFSAPLAERITAYLQCLFGPGARAVVSFDDSGFKGIDLVRADEEGSVPFDSLSGGAREQVAAAVRLAMAELLAAEYGSTLPIVFDDSFAYSDPERVRTLQRMLDLGASRGLQIIVLTCSPSDYAALGARQVVMH